MNVATKKPRHYLGNESLKAAGVSIEFTLDQAMEYDKCSKDPIYFIENYAKIVSLDSGSVLFKLYPYQKRIILAIHNNRKIISKLPRQSGKSTVVAAYLAWYSLFNDFKRSAILANKAAIAREIFSRVQFVLESLPFWLQQGVLEWNKTSFALENGSTCFCAASSPSSIRGKSINFLMCVAGETIVQLKHKKTQVVYVDQIENVAEIYQPTDFEVLTDTGWSEFSGVKVTHTSSFIKLKLANGIWLRCTIGHRLMTDVGWKESEKIKPNNLVLTAIGYIPVTSLELGSGGIAYDIVGVKNNSRYYTNDILSHNCDEFAHLDNNLAEDFIASVFPTISSSQESKLCIVSTPKGMNAFHKMWVDAENGRNGFVACEGTWQEHPMRDQKWADEQLAILGSVRFAQEIGCSFAGSSKTLVDGKKLGSIAFQEPVFEKDKLKIYKKPIPGNSYICTVDTSRGQHLDYSAFVIFDTTTVPYQVVATFKDNTISSMTYPYMIINTCKQFNDAYLLIEVNDIGGEVANIIFYEFEYPNVYFTNKENLTEGQGYPGVRTTKKVKAVGCSVLKELVEQDQLIINSIDIIQELAVFSAKGASYAAEDTKINDDLTACLFLFSWLTKQMIFKDITNTNIRALLAKKNEEYILDQMTPFGFIDNGLDSIEIDMLSSKPRDISGSSMSIDDWIMS